MSSKYALCSKIEGKIVYLRRYSTDKYNSSSLETLKWVFEFGEIGDDTLLATKDEWASWLTPVRFNEITEFMTEYTFSNFRIAFVKVEKKYETSICSPFYLNSTQDELGNTTFKSTINWDSFC